MINKLLSPKRRAEIASKDRYYKKRSEEFKNMTNESLISSIKFWCSQMETPYKYSPGTPVYDATFWHIIIPEIIERLKK